jgi:hypothetical protein
MNRTTNITMVHPARIASMGYPGCKTVQSVTNFCKKNRSNINCTWWSNNNQKILLVDPQSFRECYRNVVMGTGTQMQTRGRKVKRTTSGSRTTRRSQTTNRSRATMNTRTRRTGARRRTVRRSTR